MISIKITLEGRDEARGTDMEKKEFYASLEKEREYEYITFSMPQLIQSFAKEAHNMVELVEKVEREKDLKNLSELSLREA